MIILHLDIEQLSSCESFYRQVSLPTKRLFQSHAAVIAQKRAEIAAKVAAMRGGGASIAAPTPVKPIASAVPMVKSASSTPPGLPDDLAKKIAEAKKKVVAAQSKLAVKDNPYMVSISAILFYVS